MKISGKALPPRAAGLLIFDFMALVVATPFLFMLASFMHPEGKSVASVVVSTLRVVAMGLACQAVFYYNELYNLQIVRQHVATLTGLLRAFALIFLILAVGSIAFPATAPMLSRVLLVAICLAALAFVARVLALPRERERLLILSPAEEAAELQQTVIDCPEWNLEIAQIAHPSNLDTVVPHGTEPTERFDRIIVAEGFRQDTALLERMLEWKLKGLPVESIQTFYERARGRIRMHDLTLDQCLFSTEYSHGIVTRRLKRMLDVCLGVILLLLFAPIIALVALLIVLQRDGPVIFRQDRIGLNGKVFQIYKFRTMRSPVGDHSPKWATEEVDRITPVGQFLRKYRFDELPQLVNILKGEMSLVGPRPEQPEFCRLLAEHIPFYAQRHAVLPGLTGWAQVRYQYGASIEESRRKTEFDLFYVKHLSFGIDCAILLETVKVVLVGRGAL
ncbi:exopolysaccharide biosynthesis polyprenyl glycosylphosphotransferase [Granulicella mallensis]|uniref:Exopolysaccharide biosynthesis polyprenyl glycosylphosphotransferase n=1 Tax=Granulicella mallensis (strain ATCC BAA-1857 / DSM 23137 / MP5ACTX8) TaxID=682795 RepID=G8NXB4_GRAMM|nr:exopolysaccharide biosynthesis polyprenyl glycosylphosphotransferase [Granulicella mallensis]AEU37821.1 exopolysaccharide biosynthesis polyprenyl glycosylphosphotransferase [Granulicella mallensis MP5ACTX8]